MFICSSPSASSTLPTPGLQSHPESFSELLSSSTRLYLCAVLHIAETEMNKRSSQAFAKDQHLWGMSWSSQCSCHSDWGAGVCRQLWTLKCGSWVLVLCMHWERCSDASSQAQGSPPPAGGGHHPGTYSSTCHRSLLPTDWIEESSSREGRVLFGVLRNSAECLLVQSPTLQIPFPHWNERKCQGTGSLAPPAPSPGVQWCHCGGQPSSGGESQKSRVVPAEARRQELQKNADENTDHFNENKQILSSISSFDRQN